MKLKSLDIETILGEEERLPCTFLVDGADMGSLDPTLHSVDLPAMSRVSLPLWLADHLASKQIVQMELPKHFGKRMREDIRAGPEAINLRDFSFYYFEIGLKLGAATEDSDLMMTLRQAISGDRFKTVTYHTLFSGGADSTEFIQQMTSLELRLYTQGHAAIKDIIEWRNRKTAVLKAIGMLASSSNR